MKILNADQKKHFIKCLSIKFFKQKFEMMSRELKIKFKHIFNFFVYKRDVHLCHGLVEK
jgi:hypothetical protein